MRKRGRPSSDEIATANVVQLRVPERPAPPKSLTREQAEVWREIVASVPADWFPRETHPLLEQLCRHTVEANRIAKLIDEATRQMGERRPGATETYLKLLQAQRRETASLKSLAVALRLSPSSRMRPEVAGRRRQEPAAGDRRPWEGD